MIDFHCHLDLYPSPVDVTRKCVEADMYVLSVTNTPSAWRGTSALAKDAKKIRTALGLHPQLAKERKFELKLFDELIHHAKYVGEVGLDGGPEFSKAWNDQLFVFEHIMKKCTEEGGRVLSIHSRRATKEVLNVLEHYPAAGVSVLHWFSGTPKELDRGVALGCYFSVGPSMLLSEKGRKLTQRMPRERVLTESDGPYATLDQRSILPWDVNRATASLAELWGTTPAEALQQLMRNLKTVTSNNGLS